MMRLLFIAVGWSSVALAIAGAVLPLVPCTPFVLLAAACFARSSPRMMRRLRRSPLLGPVLRDWQRYHGMRPLAKVAAVFVAVSAPALTYLLQPGFSVPLAISLAGGLVALGIVAWLPTIRAEAAAPCSAGLHKEELRRAA